MRRSASSFSLARDGFPRASTQFHKRRNRPVSRIVHKRSIRARRMTDHSSAEKSGFGRARRASAVRAIGCESCGSIRARYAMLCSHFFRASSIVRRSRAFGACGSSGHERTRSAKRLRFDGVSYRFVTKNWRVSGPAVDRDHVQTHRPFYLPMGQKAVPTVASIFLYRSVQRQVWWVKRNSIPADIKIFRRSINSGAGPQSKAAFDQTVELLARRALVRLNRDPLEHGDEDPHQSFRVDMGGQVALRLGALEALGDRDFGDLAALYHLLANRLGLGP